MSSEDLHTLFLLAVGAIVGWLAKRHNDATAGWSPRPAIALALLPSEELRDLTPPLRATLDDAIVALRTAQDRVRSVQSTISRATTGFAQPGLDRVSPTESDRTLGEAWGDISHAIGSLAAETSLTPDEHERLTRRYKEPDKSWLSRLR